MATAHWRDQAMAILDGLSAEQRHRFELLPDVVKTYFTTGRLNPALVLCALSTPQFFADLEQDSSSLLKILIARLADTLGRIRLSLPPSSKLLVVAVPHPVYVSALSHLRYQALGFSLNPDMLTSATQDNLIRQASALEGLSTVSVTELFRSAQSEPLFFEWDGHMNARGHDLLARSLLPYITRALAGQAIITAQLPNP
jgi:hypothetical protein